MYFGGGEFGNRLTVLAQKEKKRLLLEVESVAPGLRGLHGAAVPSVLRPLRWIRLVFCRSGRLFFLALTLLFNYISGASLMVICLLLDSDFHERGGPGFGLLSVQA